MFPDLIFKIFQQAFNRSHCTGSEGTVSAPQMLAHAFKHGDIFFLTFSVFDPYQKVPDVR
jgi:Pyruvate/2-oxoacid:ferredoxin oxidoreductase gamma subunit